MIDSRAALKNSIKKINNIKTNNEYKELKKELKTFQNQIICTSLYFQYFDFELSENINMRRSYYLSIAADIAKQSNMFQKHGAIVVYKKNIISKGCNIFTNQFRNNYSMHAEIVAINNAIKKNISKDILNKSELFVVRISNCNILKYSKPCINCQKYIKKFSIKKTYYSTNYEYDKMMGYECIECY